MPLKHPPTCVGADQCYRLASMAGLRRMASRVDETHQNLPLLHGVANGTTDRGHNAIGWSRQAKHSFHRFEDEQNLPPDDGVPLSREHLGDQAWDRCAQSVGPAGFVVRAGDRIGQAQAPSLAVQPQGPRFTVARDDEAFEHTVQHRAFVATGPVEHV